MKGGGLNLSGLSNLTNKVSGLSKGLDNIKTGLSQGTNALNNLTQTGLAEGTNSLKNLTQTGLAEGTNALNNLTQTGLAEGTNALNNLTQTVKSAVPTTEAVFNQVASGTAPAANPLTPAPILGTSAPILGTIAPGTTASIPGTTESIPGTTAPIPGTSASIPGTVASIPVPAAENTVAPAVTIIFSFANIFEWIKGNIGKTIFIIVAVITAAILIYIFVSPKSKKEGFFESSKKDETKEQNSKQVKIDEVERQLQERINNINTNLTTLKKRMDDADIVKDNKPTNLAIAIQNNILAVKEAMMKIIAGLVVQTKMNNGALSVVSQTNAFQQGINDSLSKFN